MKWLQIVSVVALAAKLACGGDDAAPRNRNTATTAASTVARPGPAVRLPNVLKNAEPTDSRVVMLPGGTASTRTAAPFASGLVAPGSRPNAVPILPPAPEVSMAHPTDRGAQLVLASISNNPFAMPGQGRARLAPLPSDPHKPAYSSAFAQESAVFCQREIGHWTLPEARAVLGEAQRQRPAVDDDAVENGHIYAFRDPSNRYRELELDFDKGTGLLRSVFVYPWNLTWQECRRLWGANVSSTQGNKGRIFYSYVNRHLDVLVDHDGKVISLGL